MKVHQIYTDSPLRNFSYIIEGKQGHCFIIDPFDGEDCLKRVHGLGGIVRGVINTHEHDDHTQGNAIIAKKTACAFYAHPNAKSRVKEANCFLNHEDEVKVDEETCLKVLDTPGHTFAHLCFVLIHKDKPLAIFTGDTLFNAGIGHCRLGGDPEVYYETMKNHFFELSDDLILYPGHEYLENNLGFTLSLESENEDAKELLGKAKEVNWCQECMQTTIGVERKINTFMRLDNEQIRSTIGLEHSPAKEVFIRLRQLRDNW